MMHAIAEDVARLRALRAVKDLDRRYAHLTLLRRWAEAAELFTEDAVVVDGGQTVTGRAAIAGRLRSQAGASDAAGAFRVELVDEPLAHLGADGTTARARWSTIFLAAEGDGTTAIGGGIYENDYVHTPDGWRIAAQRRFPQYQGTHAEGWVNIDGADLPMIPYHFTVDEAGVPFPAGGVAPSDPARPGGAPADADLAAEIGALEDEGAVRNLVHAYGYYVDRRMWTDVVDLCAADAQVTLQPGGVFTGPEGVRAAMLTMGPEGLETGHLNDRPLFDTLVRMLPGAMATTRSIELGMLGDAPRGEAAWEVRVLTTRCAKVDGVWRLLEVNLEQAMRADYFRGWGQADVPRLSAPRAEDPLAGATERLAGPASDLAPARMRVQLDRALAYDGVENVSSAYGYYIDDFQWEQMSALFAENGNKHSPFAGYYFGRERITAAATSFWGAPPQTRPGISYHWRTQPVISISDDGRSATFRVRLFQPRTHKLPSRQGDFYAAGFHSGMYPNDQAVLEDGQWRLWSLTIDEPYFVSLDWAGGWASVPPTDGHTPGPSRLMELYPPDLAMTALGRRAEHFRGGTGQTRSWPEILPMWFHYRNPVSGRVPEHFWPDGVPSEAAPHTSMAAHGYQLPADGPRVAETPR